MRCADVQARITAYLDGDVDVPTASALRGHLRGCDACRHLAEDHATLAKTLADLPAAEPPAQLWDGVMARLAEAEKVDDARSRWGLFGQRALHWLRMHLVPVAAVAAAATVAVVWMAKPAQDTDIGRSPDGSRIAVSKPELPAPKVATPGISRSPDGSRTVQIPAKDQRDIETALALEAQRIDQKYADVVTELSGDVDEERPAWSAAQRRAFDAEVTRLRAAVDSTSDVSARAAVQHRADEDPFDAREADTAHREQRERAWQRLVAYLQRAAIGELEEARK
jgi:anti-sigma factor RsiW